MKLRINKFIIIFGLLLVGILCFHVFVISLVNKKFAEKTVSFKEYQLIIKPVTQSETPIKDIQPFKESLPFDEEANNWSSWVSQYGGSGICIFDANNDGMLDCYFTQDGQNIIKATDEKGFLNTEPTYQRNGLFVNKGTDEKGDLIFKPVWELCQNELYQKEELLVEGYLYPRKNNKDSTKRFGRGSNMAIAVDINGDGLLDLYVANEPKGMQYSTPETQLRLGQFINPVDRRAKSSKAPVESRGLYLIPYSPDISQSKIRQSDRGTEPEGANSLFLNMGDRDQDGLPEWKDISRSANIEGFRATYGLAAADFDGDGDIDIFAANTMDLDVFPQGSKRLAGGANCLYLNQLKETGEVKFIEVAKEWNVDGVFDHDYPQRKYERLRKLPILPEEYSLYFMKVEEYKPEFIEYKGVKTERGQISWAAIVQDFNDDGFPDIWVANDLGFLELFENVEGKKFRKKEHARSNVSGAWMTFVPADFNGDGKEDLFAGNLGGGAYNHGYVALDPRTLFEPTINNSMGLSQYFTNRSKSTHAVINGASINKEFKTLVLHSKYLPPDTAIPSNFRKVEVPGAIVPEFDQSSLDPCEFAWGATSIDIQNDGKPDFYYIGGMLGRGGGLMPVMGTGPGRLMVNRSNSKIVFEDLTVEHHLLNMEELDYSDLEKNGKVIRKAPSQNWSKRSIVTNYDRGSWVAQGAGSIEKASFSDLIQTSENGRCVVAADLNNDGFEDIVLRNMGGYDSRSPNASNLKIKIDGQVRAVPAHNYHYPSPTNYESGKTKVLLNQYKNKNWLKVSLINDDQGSLNINGIGSKVTINQKYSKVKRVAQGGYLGSFNGPMHFGLNDESVFEIAVKWPGMHSNKIYKVNNIKNVHLKIYKNKGAEVGGEG